MTNHRLPPLAAYKARSAYFVAGAVLAVLSLAGLDVGAALAALGLTVEDVGTIADAVDGRDWGKVAEAAAAILFAGLAWRERLAPNFRLTLW